MPETPKTYQAYLLRLWHVREVRDTWRVSLEDAQTRELRGFSSLAELCRFLNEQITPSSAASGEDANATEGAENPIHHSQQEVHDETV